MIPIISTCILNRIISLHLLDTTSGAELCQAQVKLGLAKIEIFFHLIDN
jgi:hypothetical protein